jgi:hypothetical protein
MSLKISLQPYKSSQCWVVEFLNFPNVFDQNELSAFSIEANLTNPLFAEFFFLTKPARRFSIGIPLFG